MKLRAKQSAQINTANGLLFVKGPEFNDKDEQLAEGDVVDVADTFLINEDVFEVVEQLPQHPGQPPRYQVIPKGDPRIPKAARYAKLPKEAPRAES